MLSRIASRAIVAGARCSSTTGPTQQAAVVDAGERDEVNFPRKARTIDPAPVRMGFIPQTWFDMLYPKTGVTGPYMLGIGLSTFLVSKEFYVIEHEFYSGAVMAMIIVYAAKKFGPGLGSSLDAQITGIKNDMASSRTNTETALSDAITSEELSAEQAKGQPVLFQAKRENVGMQLEAVYRGRMQEAFIEVKKRLDYQLETSNVNSRFEQRHMVDWIVGNVRKSITPAQEAASLKQCISDLKALSAKA